MRALYSYFSITLRETYFGNISVTDILNLRGASYHNHCQWQVSCSGLWEFVVPNSNAIIFKTRNFFLIFLLHFCNLHQFLNIFKKKMIVIATLFRKSQTVKDLVRPLSKKHCFRTLLDSQHVKGSQTLVKSPLEHFHHIFSSLWGNLIWKISPLVIC